LGAFWALLTEHPVLVSILWGGFFIVLLGISLALGLVPKLDTEETPAVAVASTTVLQQTTATAQEDSSPVRIVIERIGVDTTIVNPDNRNIETLDAALLNGVVHYPGSGNLEDVSNLFLFGHSTGFRVVQNEAFKAFNGLKDVKENDLIRVQSKTKEYVYRVTKLSLVNADNALVDLSSTHKKLTLSTCNTFGEKQERYVVEADFIGSYTLATP
jgi:LPXTG-site transpeptidase (sortase) family protein